MSPEEREVMTQHADYWRARMESGSVVVFGPVMDPAGVYGMGIVEAEDEEEVRRFAKADPASTLNHFEIYPMRAVLPAH